MPASVASRGDPPVQDVLEELRKAASALAATATAAQDVDAAKVFHTGKRDMHSAPRRRSLRKMCKKEITLEEYFFEKSDISSVVKRTLTTTSVLSSQSAQHLRREQTDECDFPDIETAPMAKLLAWVTSQEQALKEETERLRGNSHGRTDSRSNSVTSVAPENITPAMARKKKRNTLAPRSFSALLYECWTGRQGIYKENSLVLSALRKENLPIPNSCLDPVSKNILVSPVWNEEGVVCESTEEPGSPTSKTQINYSCVRDICLWKVRTMLLKFRPSPPDKVSDSPFSKYSCERGTLSWQKLLDDWTSYSPDESHAMETEYQQQSDKPKSIMTSLGMQLMDFRKMKVTDRERRGSRTLDGHTTQLRRVFLLSTHTAREARFFWKRIQQLLQESKQCEEKTKLFGGSGIDVGPLRNTLTVSLDTAFEFTADRQWVVGKETDARIMISSEEASYRFDHEEVFMLDSEGMRRHWIIHSESKTRLIFWTIEVAHKASTVERQKKMAEAKSRKEAWEARLAQKKLIREREKTNGAVSYRAVSEYAKASLTSRFLIMLETQKKRREEKVRKPTAEFVDLPPACLYCPNMEVHETSHWMWVGASTHVPTKPTYSRICTVRGTPFGMLPSHKRIMPVAKGYIY